MTFRSALKGAAAPFALSVALLAQPVLAQEATVVSTQAGEDDEADADSTIFVTGSRIARDSNASSNSPVAAVSVEGLRLNGIADASEALRELPALSNSGSVTDSIDNGVGGVGQATLNLRGLGAIRTLVLVNGQRHVSGVTGSQVVDVSTIPTALIQRVEVLTGGASAVYGADAVTGVVNYVLMEDFEGLDLNLQGGISEQGDGFTGTAELTYGLNTADGRGNLAFSVGYAYTDQLLQGDRDFSANNGVFNTGTTYPSPLRRFQRGDISAATTPNFAQRYSIAANRFPIGFAIPTAAQFAQFFPGVTPTPAEQALIDRAANAPALAFQADPRFAISSNAGLIFRNDFSFFSADINNNGINDCRESYIGLTGFGGGGCYVSTPGGGVKIYEDGIVASSSNQFGGDGAPEDSSPSSMIPRNERINVAMLGHYELLDGIEAFWDAKYVRTETQSQNPYNTFYDSLLIRPDNPFIPAVLRADAVDAGGLRVSRDFFDLGPGISVASRDTYRIVGGFRGDFDEDATISWEVFANYGKTDSRLRALNTVLPDRLFAAIDAVDAGQFLTGTPNGRIVCRSDLDRNARHPGSEIFPVIPGGFRTFNPGDGSCVPITLFNGVNSVSPAGVNFITTTTTDRVSIEQFVIGGTVVGDSSSFFELPGGAIGFAVGAEYREEASRFNFDPLELGIAPITTPDIQAGQFVGDVANTQSLTFDGTARVFNTSGRYNVSELFGELRLPLLADTPFFETLEVTGAARYSNYSTSGGSFTWSVTGTWAPIEDIRFRGAYSVAIRAPNISELFSPQQGTTFRPADPCDVAQLAVLPADRRAVRQANCVADFQRIAGGASLVGRVFDAQGNYIYTDPLTARFSGTTGGNPNLLEETATTYTFGGVITPRFLPGLTLSADYYNIEIEDGIGAVSAQDTVNICYDSTTFPNNFCGQFTRISNPASQTFLGFNFLAQSQLNFGRIATAGIDASITYNFDIGEFDFGLGANGTWVDYIDRFFDPSDPTRNNPGLGEEQRPEWAGSGFASVGYGPLTLRYSLQYISSTTLQGLDIETAQAQAGPAGFAPEYFVHDVTASLDVNDDLTIYGGVNNLTNERPYPTNLAYPVSPYGRYFFLGINFRNADLGF